MSIIFFRQDREILFVSLKESLSRVRTSDVSIENWSGWKLILLDFKTASSTMPARDHVVCSFPTSPVGRFWFRLSKWTIVAIMMLEVCPYPGSLKALPTVLLNVHWHKWTVGCWIDISISFASNVILNKPVTIASMHCVLREHAI